MSHPVDLPLSLDRDKPLATQIATQIRELLSGGALATGDRLPSTRAVAADVGVSRGVLEVAYDQLLAEGWLSARTGSGTFVATTAPRPAHHPARSSARRPIESLPARPPIRLDTGTPWIDPRHRVWWARAWRAVADATPPTAYPEPHGLPELRTAIADYAARTRGITCTPDQVMVTNGTTDGLRHLLGVLPPGTVAVEDPGYRAAATTVTASRHRRHDIPVDEQGANLAAHPVPHDLRAAYVTPAHQHPTGATMSAQRRVDLLAVCRPHGALVLEDDYDSHFRYDVAPLPALASLDQDAVVHLGTASKVVMPGLRLGWVIASVSLLGQMAARRAATHDLTPWPVQHAFLHMLRDGYVDRLVRSARMVYAARGRRVASALAPFGQVTTPVAGMYLTVTLPEEQAVRVQDRAARDGVDVPLLSWYARTHPRSGLIIGFGGITDGELSHALDVLRLALDHR